MTDARMIAPASALCAAFLSLAAQALGDTTRVCVEVTVHGTEEEVEEPPAKAAVEQDTPVDEVVEEFEEEEPVANPKPKVKILSHQPYDPALLAGPHLPLGQTPERYLVRLIEHYITHEPGFEAVHEECDETVRVEMYPLEIGWTVFARYSGNGREERIDQLFPTELSQFAERAALALLRDEPLSATINKENVLKADSKKSVQQIKGKNHFALGVGAQIRGGWIQTVVTDGSSSSHGGTEPGIRIMSPMLVMLGYRGQFESWGLEAMCHLAIGTQTTAARKNPDGGHIDFGGDAALLFHLFRYTNPRGLVSFYYGAGATFELLWFTAIRRAESRATSLRRALVSGGLDIDLVLGWEFMRANAVQFYLQGEVNAPVYVVQSENNHGTIKTWFPGVSLKIGILF